MIGPYAQQYQCQEGMGYNKNGKLFGEYGKSHKVPPLKNSRDSLIQRWYCYYIRYTHIHASRNIWLITSYTFKKKSVMWQINMVDPFQGSLGLLRRP